MLMQQSSAFGTYFRCTGFGSQTWAICYMASQSISVLLPVQLLMNKDPSAKKQYGLVVAFQASTFTYRSTVAVKEVA